ncbi:hypothetical protein, partial [Intestinibacter sp.]|uniref:hypothetical protein n=1 Tax=Intestinibacter sp. TaxID=1965304 RepID=UPI003F189133
ISDAMDYYFDLANKVIQEDSNKHKELEILLKKHDNCLCEQCTEIEEEIYKYLVENCGVETLDEYAESYNDDSDDYMYSSYYSIEAKNPENEKYADIIHKINNLFEYDARYC